MSSVRRRVSLILVTGVWLAGCATGPGMVEAPVVGVESVTHDELVELPPPAQKIAVAVYAFEDETGQFEFSDTVQTLSRAVTQGATSILIEALLEAGNGAWFTVVEREGIDNLLRERQIIRETRAIYEGGGDLSRNYLPPLLFAGMMLEGGIVGYDHNTLTGGLGARLLGIGGNTEFRQDTVTIYLRAISTQSGEVLESVNVSKTIFSVALAANVFRFIASDEILEIDAGVTTNEPEHVAVKQAIEKAVIALVLNGARRERWAFADPAAAAALLAGAQGHAGTQQAEATVETKSPVGAGAERSNATVPRRAAVAPPAAPAGTVRLAEAPAAPPTRPAPEHPRMTGRAAQKSAATLSIDEAMAQQALGMLIAEAGGARPSAAFSPAQQRRGAPPSRRAKDHPLATRAERTSPAAGRSGDHGRGEDGGPESGRKRRPGSDDVVTPSQALLAGLEAGELPADPEPRMEEP
jgi:curli production assembly/transport component CsgG